MRTKEEQLNFRIRAYSLFEDGYSIRQIARALRLSENTVKHLQKVYEKQKKRRKYHEKS